MDAKITVLVNPELRRQAKAIAALRGVTISDVVRDALERLVREGEGEVASSAKASPTRPDPITTVRST